jgi:opacity protein-like surface antigen
MKKYTLLCALAIVGTAPAYAAPTTTGNDLFFKPYVGADYQYTHIEDADGNGVSVGDVFKNNLNGGDIHVGARIHKNLGVELGYERTEVGKKSNVLGSGFDTNLRQQGGTLDMLGYLPVSNSVDLIGTVGAAVVETHATATDGENDKPTDIKGRAGVGAQYWLTDNVNIRGMVRYEGVSFESDVNNAVLASAGVNFQF